MPDVAIRNIQVQRTDSSHWLGMTVTVIMYGDISCS